MIQRIQSIWLALAAICGYLTYIMPLYAGKLADGTERKFLAADSFWLFPLLFGLAAAASIAIFLYKNRPTQYKVALFSALLSMVAIALEYYKVEDFKVTTGIIQGRYQIGMLFPFAMTALFFMAASGIRKDEKLVKSLDRLR